MSAPASPLHALLDAFGCAAALVDDSGKVFATNADWRALHGEALSLEGLEASAVELLRSVSRGESCEGEVVHRIGRRKLATRVARFEGEPSGVLVTHRVLDLERRDDGLRRIAARNSMVTGVEMLRVTVRELARWLGFEHAFVSILLDAAGTRARTLAFWSETQFLPDAEYDLAGSTCERVMKEGLTIVRSGVQDHFPSAKGLAVMAAQAFVGAPVRDPSGKLVGILSLLGRRPLEGDLDVQAIELLAARAGGEIARQRAEEALRRSEEQLQLALQGTNDGLFDWDITSGRVDGNARLFEMVGYAPGELAHIDDWERITHPEDAPRVREAIRVHLLGRTAVYRAEMRMRSKSGDWRWILDRGKVVQRNDKGHALRMTGLHSDTTDRKRLEAQLQISARMAAVGTLAAGLAHEINTPLAYLTSGLDAIDARARLLAEGADPTLAAELAEALAVSREGAKRVRDIVRDVKAFSRGDLSEANEPVDVGRVLGLSLRLATKELTRRARLVDERGPLPFVMGSESRLGQVFLNLLVNAAQAVPEGAAEKNEITVRARTDERGRAVVEIRDTGVGIRPEDAPHVFDPFFTTKAGEGTGLGLPLCHSIVDGLSGSISFESEPGRGTTFRVVLPSTAAPASQSRPTPPPTMRRRERVLVIDDHEAMGITLRLLLAEHEVVALTDGAAARDLLLSGERFMVVLCDLMMPGLSGIELFRQVTAKEPQLGARFVFMTGGAFSVEAQQFLAEVGAPVLEKPFSQTELRRVIAAHLPTIGGERTLAGPSGETGSRK